MTREDAIRIIKIVLAIAEDFEITVQGEEFTEEKCKEAVEMATKALEQEPCEDAISRQAVIDITWEEPSYTDALNVLTEVRDKVKALPPVKPQESSITWVTGADGAKIAFWDVPVWKVTKICEILGEPQERSEE